MDMDRDIFADRVDEAFIAEQRGQVYRVLVENTERVLIEKALGMSSGNQILAAKILGINRNTIRSKIKKLDINVDRFKS